MSPVPANEALRSYWRNVPAVQSGSSEAWLSKPEVPTTSEILNIAGDQFVDIPDNKIDGPWPSKEDYIGTHYELLREDAVAPLRDAVAEVKENPRMKDNSDICIYDNATRVVISLARAGKRISWQQSKRLIPGTLVALTPADDMFAENCVIATIAARPLAGIEQNPPEVDIFFANPEDTQINPLRKWVMVEARTGYYEAYRYNLLALQRLMIERYVSRIEIRVCAHSLVRFPLSENLMKLTKVCDAPKYIKENPYLDLSRVLDSGRAQVPLENVHVLSEWPDINSTTLDESQVSALRSMLTRELAIVHGPPGTGKTFVSVLALKAILGNMSDEAPPVIVTAQTNHALDQLLRHIAVFEPNFIRLGRRTMDQDVIKNRTLHEVRKTTSTPKIPGGLRGSAMRRLKDLTKSMTTILTPLRQKEPLSPELLRNLNIISDAQCESFRRGAEEWVRIVDGNRPPGPMASWLGDSLLPVNNYHEPEDFGFEVEDADLEFERLGELEAEAPGHAADDEESDALKGTWFHLQVHYQGEQSPAAEMAIQRALGMADMWEIPDHMRGAVYNYLWKKAVSILETSFRAKAKDYMKAVGQLKLGKWELDSMVLQNAKVVGMTITGLSKYRGLVASLKPRIVMVEEAAETLEGLVMSACMESVEHLIIVGDHKQLRGHCSIQQLEVAPFNLGISMFERLILNEVEYSELTRQRRMIPEIRKLLNPIYKNLSDHPSVLNHPDVPGMGGINSFFLTHQFPELTDNNVSRCNKSECDMIVGFFDYLVLNGVKPDDITVLTFYTGQRKMILRALKGHANLQGQFFKVATVDSYQGEENKIILLSLVRSNSYNEIGFLSIENRVCVALSRAQQGFYLFGNSSNLRTNSLWRNVLDIMNKGSKRLGSKLPLTCKKHGNQIRVYDPTGAAVADAELCNQAKAWEVESQMALMDVNDHEQSDKTGPLPHSLKPPRSLGTHSEILSPEAPNGLGPAATLASREPRIFPGGDNDGGEAQDKWRTDSDADTPAVRRVWREIVSTATLAPVKPLRANSAKEAPCSHVLVPSLLD
ncbi:hypothetical protein GP486_006591 [Trichoglossum hirsutum]|uniref:Helicase required for RNAi-mediated heterochromatin assembly 1 n=1 Tax=Trichoglossum hirsutum TaxID=265104 RepID=A0A9P8IDE9_9PEZI|nr:hypothetical protein GP486_006591 [Trichoglossum hirsutum]